MPEAYSRLYHKLATEYPEVWDNDRLLAAFVRMLRLADRIWPERPPMPAGATGRKLAQIGLVVVLPGSSYTIRGLDAERGRRRDIARSGAEARWSNADSKAGAMPAAMLRTENRERGDNSPTNEQTNGVDRARLPRRAGAPERLADIVKRAGGGGVP